MTPGPDGTVSLAELAAEAEGRLAPVAARPEAEARWIVEEVAGADGVLATPGAERPVTEREMVRFDSMIGRRLAGEPLQYVLGRWSFRTLDLAVDRRALIPRPETETVVDVALSRLDAAGEAGTSGVPPRVVDMGAGSGAIGLSIAVERPPTRVWAVELSEGAAQLARENCVGIGRHGANVTVVRSSWFEGLDDDLRRTFDLVVSNPPYVDPADELPATVARWEPSPALIAADRGRADLFHLVAASGDWLHPGGSLVLEMDPRQVGDVAAAMAAAGYVDIEVHRDLAGRDRSVSAIWPGDPAGRDARSIS